MHPETGFQEFRTSKVIEAELRSMGFDLVTGVGITGIVGTIQGAKKGKTVLLRADIDALSMQEENDSSYKSLNDGVMHSCGHDTHTAMLLGACKFFSDNKNLLEGTLKVVFQSAEEGPMPGGGSFVVNEGHLDDVDGVFGLHITTRDTVGTISIKKGPAMAAPDEFRVKVTGKGTHASAPHTGSDVILAASKIITNLQTIISRDISPLDPVVVSVCTVHGGTSFNILPDQVEFSGTIRTLNKQTRQFVFNRIKDIVSSISKLNGCQGVVEIIEAYPPVINDVVESEFVIGIGQELLGKENVAILSEPSMGGEDFSYYLEKRPGSYFWLGGRNKNLKEVYYNHNPKFDIDESSLLIGTMMHINIAIEYLKK
jgi:amidohydrolase